MFSHTFAYIICLFVLHPADVSGTLAFFFFMFDENSKKEWQTYNILDLDNCRGAIYPAGLCVGGRVLEFSVTVMWCLFPKNKMDSSLVPLRVRREKLNSTNPIIQVQSSIYCFLYLQPRFWCECPQKYQSSIVKLQTLIFRQLYTINNGTFFDHFQKSIRRLASRANIYVLRPVCTRSFKTEKGSAGGFCLVKVVTPLLFPGSKRVTHFCPWLL